MDDGDPDPFLKKIAKLQKIIAYTSEHLADETFRLSMLEDEHSAKLKTLSEQTETAVSDILSDCTCYVSKEKELSDEFTVKTKEFREAMVGECKRVDRLTILSLENEEERLEEVKSQLSAIKSSLRSQRAFFATPLSRSSQEEEEAILRSNEEHAKALKIHESVSARKYSTFKYSAQDRIDAITQKYTQEIRKLRTAVGETQKWPKSKLPFLIDKKRILNDIKASLYKCQLTHQQIVKKRQRKTRALAWKQSIKGLRGVGSEVALYQQFFQEQSEMIERHSHLSELFDSIHDADILIGELQNTAIAKRRQVLDEKIELLGKMEVCSDLISCLSSMEGDLLEEERDSHLLHGVVLLGEHMKAVLDESALPGNVDILEAKKQILSEIMNSVDEIASMPSIKIGNVRDLQADLEEIYRFEQKRLCAIVDVIGASFEVGIHRYRGEWKRRIRDLEEERINRINVLTANKIESMEMEAERLETELAYLRRELDKAKASADSKDSGSHLPPLR